MSRNVGVVLLFLDAYFFVAIQDLQAMHIFARASSTWESSCRVRKPVEASVGTTIRQKCGQDFCQRLRIALGAPIVVSSKSIRDRHWRDWLKLSWPIYGPNSHFSSPPIIVQSRLSVHFGPARPANAAIANNRRSRVFRRSQKSTRRSPIHSAAA